MVNAEHYPDPTAEIAIARADRELARKRRIKWHRNGRKHSTIVRSGRKSGSTLSTESMASASGVEGRDA